MTSNTTMHNNPLLSAWTTPFGIPPFEQIAPAHFLPAFEAAMQQHWEEVDQVAASSEAPSFDNTVVAMERAGRALDRVQLVFHNLTSSNTNADLQAIEQDDIPLTLLL